MISGHPGGHGAGFRQGVEQNRRRGYELPVEATDESDAAISGTEVA